MELKGTDLQKFIRDQQTHYRDLRAAERGKEKEEKEFQLKREALEIEKLKLQEEQGRAELDSKYRATIYHFEQQLKDTKIDIASTVSAKVHKMPFIDEVKDDIDSYLRRFERYAAAQKWAVGTWTVNLSALLRGRALDVYALLPQDQALNYEALKTSLLKRFERTEDGFRHWFRKWRPEAGETFSQFSVRLGSYLNRWIELCKVDQLFEGLFDLMLRDQFLSMCSKDLLLFLKERIPKTIDEMCALADQYKEARNASSLSLVHSGRKDSNLEPKGGASKSQQNQNDQKKPKDTQPAGKEIRCHKCLKIGHFANQCRNRNSTAVAIGQDGATKSNSYQDRPGKCSAFTSVTTTTSVSIANFTDLVNTSSCNVSAS